MALNENTLKTTLLSIFNAMDAAAEGTPKTNEWYAGELAKAITNQIKMAGIPMGQVIVSVSGGSGAPAVGVPNPNPIQVV